MTGWLKKLPLKWQPSSPTTSSDQCSQGSLSCNHFTAFNSLYVYGALVMRRRTAAVEIGQPPRLMRCFRIESTAHTTLAGFRHVKVKEGSKPELKHVLNVGYSRQNERESNACHTFANMQMRGILLGYRDIRPASIRLLSWFMQQKTSRRNIRIACSSATLPGAESRLFAACVRIACEMDSC